MRPLPSSKSAEVPWNTTFDTFSHHFLLSGTLSGPQAGGQRQKQKKINEINNLAESVKLLKSL
jgi:hypothetical protein